MSYYTADNIVRKMHHKIVCSLEYCGVGDFLVFEWNVLMGRRRLELILLFTKVENESMIASVTRVRAYGGRLTAGSCRSRI
jgi:hypothetical protein